MKVIGITGGVGAGKSTVVGILQKHYQVEYLHCDVIAHEVMEPEGGAYPELIRVFGEGILNEDKTVNRSRLYEEAFVKADRVEELNACVHPQVRLAVERRLAMLQKSGFAGIALIEAALLIEAGYKAICDELWYVYAPAEVRRARLKANRGYTDEKVDSIMEEQASEELFFKECDFVIYNDSDKEACEAHVMQQVRAHLKGEVTQ